MYFVLLSFLFQSYHFDRDDVALANFSAYFRQRSQSKRADADKLMDYQNKRGGRIRLQDVKASCLIIAACTQPKW